MKSTDKTPKGYNEKTPSSPEGNFKPDNADEDNSLAKKPKAEKAPVAEKKLRTRKK